MDLLKYTLFINLEERVDRLEHIQKELQKIKVIGERFNAKKTPNGALGCTLSHIKCLEIAKERNYPYVFICEDDITFLEPETFLNSLNKFQKSPHSENFDVLIIGGNNCPPYQKIEDFVIRVSNCQTTTGYIVKQHYYETLISNFKESAANLLRNPNKINEFAIDIFWKRLQIEGFWFMITPPTVVQYESYSDIEKRRVNYQYLMHSYFFEALHKRSLTAAPIPY
jgi:GR25 family glycosyltransferase involved in LPS biosynthesis